RTRRGLSSRRISLASSTHTFLAICLRLGIALAFTSCPSLFPASLEGGCIDAPHYILTCSAALPCSRPCCSCSQPGTDRHHWRPCRNRHGSERRRRPQRHCNFDQRGHRRCAPGHDQRHRFLSLFAPVARSVRPQSRSAGLPDLYPARSGFREPNYDFRRAHERRHGKRHGAGHRSCAAPQHRKWQHLDHAQPNPGNDLTFAAQITPGVVMNTAAGFGNFAVNGISGTSNLFTLDGMDDNDPYLNLNNSGATNLLLGLNEVQEVTVDQNGYTGQYGGLAGSNINYITRSGTNQFNGRAMNANDFFNKAQPPPAPVTPRSFVNANQWGGEFGGPIFKDKLFFYFDTEGLRVLLPTNTLTIVPSPQFEAATIANLSASHPASVPFYQNMFNLYNGASGIERSIPGNGSTDPTGCSGVSFAGLAPGAPCTLFFRSTVNNLTSEQIFAGRIDYNIGSANKIYGRIQTDHGTQASFTDPINPLFNLTSNQPEWQGQLSWNHTFGPTATNQLIIASQWYSAIFAPPNLSAALAAFPTTLSLADGSLTTLGG